MLAHIFTVDKHKASQAEGSKVLTSECRRIKIGCKIKAFSAVCTSHILSPSLLHIGTNDVNDRRKKEIEGSERKGQKIRNYEK